MAEKCCKKKCAPKKSKCKSKGTPFYNDPLFWKFLLLLNIIIILIRYNYIRCKDDDFSLPIFLMWLELQIILFFIVATCYYFVSSAVYYLVGLFFYYLKALFSPRKTPSIMKFLRLKKTDEVLFRLYCIFAMFCIFNIILFIIATYIGIFFHAVFFLLGYTKI